MNQHISSLGSSIYEAMSRDHKDAVWIMQVNILNIVVFFVSILCYDRRLVGKNVLNIVVNSNSVYDRPSTVVNDPTKPLANTHVRLHDAYHFCSFVEWGSKPAPENDQVIEVNLTLRSISLIVCFCSFLFSLYFWAEDERFESA